MDWNHRLDPARPRLDGPDRLRDRARQLAYRLPSPAEQEAVWIGSRYIFAGCALSVAAAVWSHLRGNAVWVTVCVAMPGVLVGWAVLQGPYNLGRHFAAVVTFPLALAGVVGVIRARGHRQRD